MLRHVSPNYNQQLSLQKNNNAVTVKGSKFHVENKIYKICFKTESNLYNFLLNVFKYKSNKKIKTKSSITNKLFLLMLNKSYDCLNGI